MPRGATYGALSNELAMGEIDHGSCVIAPDGTVTAVIDGGDAFALADMDLDAVRARRVGGEPVFAQRRPELYAGLLSDTFSWNPRDFFKLYGHKPWHAGTGVAGHGGTDETR